MFSGRHLYRPCRWPRRACATSGAAPPEAQVHLVPEAAPHVPVLLAEVLQLFAPVNLKTFVDGTLGAGGHSSTIVAAHPELQTLLGFDMDPAALALARPRLQAQLAQREARFEAVHSNFRHLHEHLQLLLGGHRSVVDGILVDLGMSSMQVDSDSRGFSFMRDAPLDMRMDAGSSSGSAACGLTAEEVVNGWGEADLGHILRDYGEERHWRLVARRIVDAREQQAIRTTSQLVAAIGRLPGGGKGRGRGSKAIHPATRTFQALRIAVNDELGSLEALLPAALDALRPGGRLALISFHSLEDRLVKHAMQRAAGIRRAEEGAMLRYLDPADDPAPLGRLVTRKAVVAGNLEVGTNSRARSAKLRCLEKL